MSFDKFDDHLFPSEQSSSSVSAPLKHGDWGDFLLYFAAFHVVRLLFLLTRSQEGYYVVQGVFPGGFIFFSWILLLGLASLLYLIIKVLPDGAPSGIRVLLIFDILVLFAIGYLVDPAADFPAHFWELVFLIFFIYSFGSVVPPVLWMVVGWKVGDQIVRKVLYLSSGVLPALLFSISLLDSFLDLPYVARWFVGDFYGVIYLLPYVFWSLPSAVISLFAWFVYKSGVHSSKMPRFFSLTVGSAVLSMWLFTLQLLDWYPPSPPFVVASLLFFLWASVALLVLSALSLLRSSSLFFNFLLLLYVAGTLFWGWRVFSSLSGVQELSVGRVGELFVFLTSIHLLFWVVVGSLSHQSIRGLSSFSVGLLGLSLLIVSIYPFTSLEGYSSVVILGFFGFSTAYAVLFLFQLFINRSLRSVVSP